MVEWSNTTTSNGKLLFKLRHAGHGLLMLVSQVMATIIKYGICIMKQPINI